MLHVTDRKKWNRTKGWLAFGCWATALISVGFDEQSTTHQPRYDIALIAMSLCAGLMFSIFRRR